MNQDINEGDVQKWLNSKTDIAATISFFLSEAIDIQTAKQRIGSRINKKTRECLNYLSNEGSLRAKMLLAEYPELYGGKKPYALAWTMYQNDLTLSEASAVHNITADTGNKHMMFLRKTHGYHTAHGLAAYLILSGIIDVRTDAEGRLIKTV